jgi:putative molybdenum carrier protein
MKIVKIVSGGQTGADRAALDWAIDHGIPHGGWCPAGRLAEDGAIPECYALQEVPDGGGGYRRRTKANVRDSDATLIVSIEPVLSGGSKETALFAQRLAKPWLHVHPAMDWRQALRAWLDATPITVLNVAGPRASREADVGAFTTTVLDELLFHLHSR